MYFSCIVAISGACYYTGHLASFQIYLNTIHDKLSKEHYTNNIPKNNFIPRLNPSHVLSINHLVQMSDFMVLKTRLKELIFPQSNVS